jgi:hypothetical protein
MWVRAGDTAGSKTKLGLVCRGTYLRSLRDLLSLLLTVVGGGLWQGPGIRRWEGVRGMGLETVELDLNPVPHLALSLGKHLEFRKPQFSPLQTGNVNPPPRVSGGHGNHLTGSSTVPGSSWASCEQGPPLGSVGGSGSQSTAQHLPVLSRKPAKLVRGGRV